MNRISIVLVMTAALTVCCSPSPSAMTNTTAETTKSPKPSGSDGAVAPSAVDVCIGPFPTEWAHAWRALALPDDLTFAPYTASADGGVTFGAYRRPGSDGIAKIDLSSGALRTFSTEQNNPGWMVTDAPWIVWTNFNSTTNINDWSIVARNIESNEQFTIATSRRADGTFVFGQLPLPLIHHGAVLWAQPTSSERPITADLRLFDLTSRRERTLATGRLSAPVLAGDYVLWARQSDGGDFSFEGLDANSLEARVLPRQLGSPGPIVYVAGSSRYLAWSRNQFDLNVFRFDRSDVVVYHLPGVTRSFQFLTIAGRYLVWFATASYVILDLERGVGTEISGATVTASEAALVRAEAVRPSTTKGELIPTRVSALALANLPHLPGC